MPAFVSVALAWLTTNAKPIEAATAVVGGAVAVVTAGVSIWGRVADDRHKKKSVTPALSTEMKAEPIGSHIERVNYYIINQGLGPAIIKSFETLLDGQPISLQNADELVTLLMNDLGFRLVANPRTEFTTIRKGHVLGTSSRTQIASFAFVSNPQAPAAYMNALQRLGVRVGYESQYGEAALYDSREHFLAT